MMNVGTAVHDFAGDDMMTRQTNVGSAAGWYRRNVNHTVHGFGCSVN